MAAPLSGDATTTTRLDRSRSRPEPPSAIPEREVEEEGSALAEHVEGVVRALRDKGQDLVTLRGGGVVILPRPIPRVRLVQGRKALRHYDNEAVADCVLILNPRGVRVYACADYLVQRSDLFKAMLTHGAFLEASTRCLSLHLPCPAQGDAALRFLYTGGELPPDMVADLDPPGFLGLLENARYLQSHELTAAALAALRTRLRESDGVGGEHFLKTTVADPAFGPDLIPLEWIVAFVRCTPERSTTERVRAALAWAREADLEDPGTKAALAPLSAALETRIAATSPGEVAALLRESGRGALTPLVSVDASLAPVLERAAQDTRAVLGRQRELRFALAKARRALASMEALTAFRRCERCRVHVPMYLADDTSCTQTYHPGRYFTFNESTRRGGWTCCGATSKTVKGCRGRDCQHRFSDAAEGPETFAGLSRDTVPPVEGENVGEEEGEGEEEGGSDDEEEMAGGERVGDALGVISAIRMQIRELGALIAQVPTV